MQTSQTNARRVVYNGDLLPPESGMPRPRPSPNRQNLIEDAIFEVVGPSDFRWRQTNDNPPPPFAKAEPMVRPPATSRAIKAIGDVERRINGLSTRHFALLSAALFLAGFWVFGGLSALSAATAAAKTPAFAVSEVFTDVQDANGMQLAVVGGTLINRSDDRLPAPRLVVSTASGNRVGVIETGVSSLEAGASQRFAGRFRIAGGKSTSLVIIPETR